MNSVKFLEEEIEFYKRRIEQAKKQLEQTRSLNKIHLSQLSSNDKVLTAFINRNILHSSKVGLDDTVSIKSKSKSATPNKITPSTYKAAISGIEKDGEACADDDILVSILEYQNKKIEKLTKNLTCKEESRKGIDSRFKELKKVFDKVESMEKGLHRSREKNKVKMLVLIDEEREIKNKAWLMNVDIEKAKVGGDLNTEDICEKEGPTKAKNSKEKKIGRAHV